MYYNSLIHFLFRLTETCNKFAQNKVNMVRAASAAMLLLASYSYATVLNELKDTVNFQYAPTPPAPLPHLCPYLPSFFERIMSS